MCIRKQRSAAAPPKVFYIMCLVVTPCVFRPARRTHILRSAVWCVCGSGRVVRALSAWRGVLGSSSGASTVIPPVPVCFCELLALCVFARAAEWAYVLCIACLFTRRGSVSAQRV